MTDRAIWPILLFLMIPLLVSAEGFAEDLPRTGKVVSRFESLEKTLRDFQQQIEAPAMTVAVSRQGKLLYSRGFGWRTPEKKEPVKPDDLMRIASITKPMTAAAIRKLIRDGELKGSTQVIDYLELTPRRGERMAPGLKKVTIDHLLNHRGGWDREESFDPMFRSHVVEQHFRLRGRARPEDIIRYMLTKPLQFEPGERYAYSNFGYSLLGRVIEKAAGEPYFTYLDRAVLKPNQIKSIQLARDKAHQRAGNVVVSPDAYESIEVMDAHGGLVASSPALCQFLDHYWLNGAPRKPEERGDWTFFGSLPGTTAMVRQLPDGFNVSVLLNARRGAHLNQDNKDLKKRVDEEIAHLGFF